MMTIDTNVLERVKATALASQGASGNVVTMYADQNSDWSNLFESAWDNNDLTPAGVKTTFFEEYLDDYRQTEVQTCRDIADEVNRQLRDLLADGELDATEDEIDALTDDYLNELWDSLEFNYDEIVNDASSDMMTHVARKNPAITSVEMASEISKYMTTAEADFIQNIAPKAEFKRLMDEEFGYSTAQYLGDGRQLVEAFEPEKLEEIGDNDTALADEFVNLFDKLTSDELLQKWEELSDSIDVIELSTGEIVVTH